MAKKRYVVFALSTMILVGVIGSLIATQFEPEKDKFLLGFDTGENIALILIVSFSYLPTILMVIGGISPIWGLLPPTIITGLFWVIITQKFIEKGIYLESQKSLIIAIPCSITILSGLFALCLSFSVKNIINKHK